MKKTDFNSKASATDTIHIKEIADIFLFGNENIYDYDADKLYFGYEMTFDTLSKFGLPSAQYFSPDNLSEEAIMNVRLNNKGGFFCCTINPINETDRAAISIVIGQADISKGPVLDDVNDDDLCGIFDPIFVLTGEIGTDGHFTPSQSVFMVVNSDGDRQHVVSSSVTHSYKQLICYADEAFTAVIADEVPLADPCQDWFHPETDVDTQYRNITKRSAEDLAHILMDFQSAEEPTATLSVAPHLH